MDHSIKKIPRSVRKRLKKIVQNGTSASHVRRATALLLLHDGHSYSSVARHLKASRNSVKSWARQYELYGEAGLEPETGGRPASFCKEKVGNLLIELVQKEPRDYGYARSRWTSEMLADTTHKELGVWLHASTVRRLLPELGIRWKRAKPTLHIKDPNKSSKIRKINKALKRCDEAEPVFYVDEVDIDLNPKIGSTWSLKGQQTNIPTPGKNEKRYLCGALHATTGAVIWVEWERKNTDIFLLMMAELRKRYRKARKIHLILDNYRIHKSHRAGMFLKSNPKFNLLFQPAYHPWINKIELLWKKLHDTVTRNHKHSTINQLMKSVRQFMRNASKLIGTALALAQSEDGQ